jgi:hypothetical protein
VQFRQILDNPVQGLPARGRHFAVRRSQAFSLLFFGHTGILKL